MASSFDQDADKKIRRLIEDDLREWGKWAYAHGCSSGFPESLYEQLYGKPGSYDISDDRAMFYDGLIAMIDKTYPEMMYKPIMLKRYLYQIPFEFIADAFEKKDRVTKPIIIKRHDFVIGFIVGSAYQKSQTDPCLGFPILV